MQIPDLEPGLSPCEIAPEQFASYCWEVHEAMRGDLARYLGDVVNDNRGMLYGLFDARGDYLGRVAVEIHPGYLTRGRPCATFGWLGGLKKRAVTALLSIASTWASKQIILYEGRTRRNTLLRGPVSFPKHLGGLGCQVAGFNHPRMAGVSTNRPALGSWIGTAGFKADAPYACLDVSDMPVWKSGEKVVAKTLTLTYFDLEEWTQRENEVLDLVGNVFGSFLPDATPGRFHDILVAVRTHPKAKYFIPAAIDASGKLVGFILCWPNMWEYWGGHTVTGVNIDTAIISPAYRGKGLFAALNNMGQRNGRFYGVPYYEGTNIWYANEAAVKSIFPHGTVVRRHVVFQRRLKKGSLLTE